MRNPFARLMGRRRDVPDTPVHEDDYWNDWVDEGEVFVGQVDWLGSAITVGSTVLYPGPFQRNKVQMVLGEVEDITDDGRLAIRVKRRSRDGGSLRPKEKIYLAEAGRGNVTVIQF